uniref:Uncharacterized protein n=1 Tax=Anguilla anguilla TaxID=7936 RepID=A0A0E9X1H9_ANGAN
MEWFYKYPPSTHLMKAITLVRLSPCMELRPAHFNVKAESNVNASEAKHHRPSPAGTVIWSVCGSVALLTLIVLSSVIIRRKLQRKGRKKPGTSERCLFSTEEIQDIEPYITYSEKTNAIYSS